MRHMPEIGEVYYTSFGYDETHYHFIKIVGFTKSGKSTICRRVYKKSVEGKGNMVYDCIKPSIEEFGDRFNLKIVHRQENEFNEKNHYTVLRGSYPAGIDGKKSYMRGPESFFKCGEKTEYYETNPQFGH